MNDSASHDPTGPLGLRPVVAGTACCIISAVGYTLANICTRMLDQLGCHPAWAVCNKELVTVVVVGPWLLWQAWRGASVLPSWRTVGALTAVGLVVQLVGNLGIQWAYGVVGLAIVIPAMFGVTVTASAAMGRFFLGERVSWRSLAALGLLLFSLALLTFGALATGKSAPAASAGPLWLVLGIGAAGLAGLVFALLTITIRRTVTRQTHTTVIVLIVTLMGVLTLGPLSWVKLGPQVLLDTPAEQVGWMALAGVFNLIAFLAITKGLELTTVVHANLLNASQVAMAAVAGIVLFAEQSNPLLIGGVALTVLGVAMIGPPEQADREVDLRI